MSKKDELRIQRENTVINEISKKQEQGLGNSLNILQKTLQSKYGVKIVHESQWLLKDIINELRKHYPEVDFFCKFKTSSMRPDHAGFGSTGS